MKKGVDYIGVGVGAMIFNQKGELLLLKRSQNAKDRPNHWEIPGGSINFMEKAEAAIRREVQEECGVEFDTIEQLSTEDHIFPDNNQHWIGVEFLGKLKSGEIPKILEPDIFDDIGWFLPDKLPSPVSIVVTKNVERLKNKIKKYTYE